MSAPPPALLVYGHSGCTEEEQSLFDPLSMAGVREQCENEQKRYNMYSDLLC